MPFPTSGPLSKDIIDRRNGQKPTLGEKVRDVAVKVRTDWNDMKQEEANKSNPSGQITDMKQIGANIPSYKKGGKVRRTGLARVHKGERVIPKSKVKRVEKLMKMKKG